MKHQIPIKKYRLKPDSRISDIAYSPLLEALTASEMLVLLRLVAATRVQGRVVKIKNSELLASRRTAQRSLARLSALGIVLVQLQEDDNARTVEVLCL